MPSGRDITIMRVLGDALSSDPNQARKLIALAASKLERDDDLRPALEEIERSLGDDAPSRDDLIEAAERLSEGDDVSDKVRSMARSIAGSLRRS